MKMLDPRRILAEPWFYKTFRRIITTEAGRRGLVEDYFKPQSGYSVLDIGCGTADVLDDLPDVRYHGFDASEKYLGLARARHGDRGTFVNASVSRDMVAGEYDLVMAIGVLHHLSDTEAEDLLAVARSVLKPGGRLVTVDPCFHDGQAAIRRLVISLDRGEHVRMADEYVQLALPHFKNVNHDLRTGLVRIPYTHIILECSG